MTILHFIATLHTGGAENLLVDMLPALRDMGNEVELLVMDGTRTPFYEQLEQNGIPIHHVTIGGSIYHPHNIWKISKIINGFDIIHTHTYPCQLFIPIAKLLSKNKCRIVTTEHSTNNHRRGKWWFKLLDRWMYRQYDRIICITEMVKSNLQDHLGNEERMCVINNGIDVNKYYNPISIISNKGKISITMVASMRDAKDQDTLIRALSHLPENFILNLVGDGYRRPLIEKLISDLDLTHRVKLLGNRNDIPDILKQSDICVLSSHWEGFGLSAIESMATGKPTIASDVQGLADIVRGYGLIFPHEDDVKLAEMITLLSCNQEYYQHIAEKCQNRAKQFDISATAKKYNELYQSL